MAKTFFCLHETKCIFGDHASDATFVSEVSFMCSTPVFSTMQSIPLSLSVSTNEFISVCSIDIVPVPVIFAVNPYVVSTRGATLTIIGNFFKDFEGHVCAFGSNFTSTARVISDDRVECQAHLVTSVAMARLLAEMERRREVARNVLARGEMDVPLSSSSSSSSPDILAIQESILALVIIGAVTLHSVESEEAHTAAAFDREDECKRLFAEMLVTGGFNFVA